MNIEISVITNINITDAPGHAPILATITDLPGGHARVTLQEGPQSVTAYWSSLKSLSGAEYIKTVDDTYLLNSFDPFGTLNRKILPDNAKKALTQAITERVESGQFTDDQATDLISRLGIFDNINDINGVIAIAGELMVQIFGAAWTENARTLLLGQHPYYTSLLSRIKLLRQALSS